MFCGFRQVNEGVYVMENASKIKIEKLFQRKEMGAGFGGIGVKA
jgi:hypothetical protein